MTITRKELDQALDRKTKAIKEHMSLIVKPIAEDVEGHEEKEGWNIRSGRETA